MIKIRTKDLILDVAKWWEVQYKNSSMPDKAEILKELRALDLTTATKEQVDGIIGNSSWINLRCDECNKYVDCVIQVGAEPDYENATAELCLDCVKKAYDLIVR